MQYVLTEDEYNKLIEWNKQFAKQEEKKNEKLLEQIKKLGYKIEKKGEV